MLVNKRGWVRRVNVLASLCTTAISNADRYGPLECDLTPNSELIRVCAVSSVLKPF